MKSKVARACLWTFNHACPRRVETWLARRSVLERHFSLVIILFCIEVPKISRFGQEQLSRCEPASEHRMILVVVSMQTIPSSAAEVLEGFDIPSNCAHRVGILLVIDGIGVRNAKHASVDDGGGIAH